MTNNDNDQGNDIDDQRKKREKLDPWNHVPHLLCGTDVHTEEGESNKQTFTSPMERKQPRTADCRRLTERKSTNP